MESGRNYTGYRTDNNSNNIVGKVEGTIQDIELTTTAIV